MPSAGFSLTAASRRSEGRSQLKSREGGGVDQLASCLPGRKGGGTTWLVDGRHRNSDGEERFGLGFVCKLLERGKGIRVDRGDLTCC